MTLWISECTLLTCDFFYLCWNFINTSWILHFQISTAI